MKRRKMRKIAEAIRKTGSDPEKRIRRAAETMLGELEEEAERQAREALGKAEIVFQGKRGPKPKKTYQRKGTTLYEATIPRILIKALPDLAFDERYAWIAVHGQDPARFTCDARCGEEGIEDRLAKMIAKEIRQAIEKKGRPNRPTDRQLLWDYAEAGCDAGKMIAAQIATYRLEGRIKVVYQDR